MNGGGWKPPYGFWEGCWAAYTGGAGAGAAYACRHCTLTLLSFFAIIMSSFAFMVLSSADAGAAQPVDCD